MAGTLFGIGLSQPVDLNGRPLVGAKLYIYDAATSEPADVYADTGLSVLLSWPIVADGNGRIPQFWLPDGGYYRARLTSASGVVQFDVNSIFALGPSTGDGGDATPVDLNALFQTGDPLWVPKTGTREGWVRHNGRTIGSASSGASERANADTQPLYTYIWQTYANGYCPVSGGRGADAETDWAANKPIATLDLRGKGPFGLDDMGNSSAGLFSGVTFNIGSATAAAAQGGEARHTLDISETPSHNHTLTDPGHKHTYNDHPGTTGVTSTGGAIPTVATASADTSTVTTGITLAATGGGGAHNNMPPFVLGTWFVKL